MKIQINQELNVIIGELASLEKFVSITKSHLL